MRWVLGEQSYAVLRSKRTEDLIFSGGGRRSPAGLAEVEPRRRSVKRQAGLARTHRDLTEELHDLLVQHYALLWRDAHRALAEAEATEQRLAAELESRRAAQTAATTDLRRVREDL